jgi:glycosidase
MSSACVSVPAAGQAPALATHVQDWRDEVIYQIITDRFADGDVNNDYDIQPGFLGRYQGGDWKGIEDHLDYLQALGVTTLWISPVVVNVDTDAGIDGYHGYWMTDLTKPNKHMGDLAALREMVAAAHDVGMKVVLDIVCNHVGQVFFYDMNLNGVPDDYVEGSGATDSPITQVNEFDPDWNPEGVQGVSSNGPVGRAPIVFIHDPTIDREPPQPGILGTAAAYHGMGHILNFSDPQQVIYGDFTGGLKDLATEVPEVQATLVDSYAKWVESVDFDGFRIDTIKHVQNDFWKVFAPAIRQRLGEEGKNDFIMFGEAFDGDDVLLGSFTVPGELDSVFYFSQHYQVFQNVFEYAYDPTMQSGTDQIQALWAAKTTNYGTVPQPGGIGVAPYKALVNFIDNHDVSRFLFQSGDVPALRNALTLLYAEEGIPDLYYGTEQNFNGGNDPADREVLWNTGFDTTNDTFTHIAKLARIRKTYVALRRGDTTVRWSSAHIGTEEDAGIFAFERSGGDAGANAYAMVVLNTNNFKASDTANGGTPMATALPPNTTLVDVLDPNLATYATDANSNLLISNIPAQTAKILIPQGQVVAARN